MTSREVSEPEKAIPSDVAAEQVYPMISMDRGPNRSVRPPVNAVSITGGPDQHRAVTEMVSGLAPK